MSTQVRIEPYLSFNGRCQEAIDYYGKAIGAKVTALIHFNDNPDVPAPPAAGDKIMHAALEIGGATVLASDGMCSEPADFSGFSLTLTARDNEEAERLFGALSADGQVIIPMVTNPFAERFGMTSDRFGVSWTILSAKED
jgi:PhnB protein